MCPAVEGDGFPRVCIIVLLLFIPVQKVIRMTGDLAWAGRMFMPQFLWGRSNGRYPRLMES